MSLLGERGRTILGYVVAGVLLSLVVTAVAHTIGYLIRAVGDVYTRFYGTGVNATGGGTVETVSIRVGNETATFPKPSNPVLSAVAAVLLSVLTAVGTALSNPLLLAVLVALTLVAYALSSG